MTFSKRGSWSPADIPDLSFREDRLWVDIGFLGGDDHRAAFAEIFARMLEDNDTVLSGMEIAAIETPRGKRLDVLLLPVSLATIDIGSLARTLYDIHEETVILRLVGRRSSGKLGIKFDDPEFWFDEAAA
jgi:hypothetical protein